MMAVLLLMPLVAHPQVLINGKPAFSDNVSNIILYPLSQESFGHDFTAVVQVDTTTHWHNITVNGQSLTSNPITFHDVTGNKVYLLRAIENRHQVVKRIMFTSLPIMSIDGDMGYDYIDTHVTLFTPSGSLDSGMRAQVKWRGGFTNGEGRHKRNYSIKFIDDNGEKQNRRLLGMRRDNHWKLDAAQVDRSRVRNRVATELWLDMAHQPYYYDQAPDAIMAARGKPVEVFAGGSYMGIYHLLESIDRKQLQVKKWDEDTHEMHGMIWNAVKWTSTTAFKSPSYYNNDQDAYNSFVIEYPEFDEVHPTHHEDLYNAVRFVAYNNVNVFNASAHTYFDMPVIIDYAILNQLLTSIDNEVNNIYWVIYDRLADKKLTLAVWDLDWSLGTNRASPDFRGGRAEATYDFEFSSRLLFMLQNPKCIYNKVMIDRYWELRKSWLSIESLTSRVNQAVEPLLTSGAVARDEARWSGDSDINGLPLDIVAERDYINDWIARRLAFLDRTLMRRPCDVNSDGGITSADISILTTHLLDGGNYDPKLDVDGDGHITANDLNIVYFYILGLN